MAVVHRCRVKYFANTPGAEGSFERGAASVEHRTYAELHSAVRAACPRGFECEEPLALFHEVHWRQRGPPTHALHHAIEVGEYPLLPWASMISSSSTQTKVIIITICVGVHAAAGGAFAYKGAAPPPLQ
jgi:hypothetical protein